MTFSLRLQEALRNVESKHGFRKHFVAAVPFWIGAAVTGCVAVAYAELFSSVENLAVNLITTHGSWIFLSAPLLFLLSFAVVHWLAPNASGSGIPQLMAASELANEKPSAVRKFLGLRIILAKIGSSLIASLGGGAIGREGPTLQISGSLFFLIQRVIPPSWGKPSLQSMILAGGGAGLAAAFNTPLGGIVYVVEELAKVHISSFRTSLLQSVIISGLVAQAFLGSYLYFGYPKLGEISYQATLGALAVGILVGASGTFFSVCLKRIVLWRSRLATTKALALQSIGCGTLMALLIVLCGTTSVGSGKESITSVLFQGEAGSVSAGFARFLAPLITYANGGAGGVFAPALASGAVLAALFKPFFSLPTPLLSVLGMVAFLTAMTQSPFTSFVLVLEMTDRHSALFPMMVTALFAYLISRFFSKTSFYEFVKERMIEDHRPSPHENRAA